MTAVFWRTGKLYELKKRLIQKKQINKRYNCFVLMEWRKIKRQYVKKIDKKNIRSKQRFVLYFVQYAAT